MQTTKTASKAEATQNTITVEELFHVTRRMMEVTDTPNMSEQTRRIMVTFGMLQDVLDNMRTIIDHDRVSLERRGIHSDTPLSHIHSLQNILGAVLTWQMNYQTLCVSDGGNKF